MDPKDLVPWLMGIVQLLLLGAWQQVRAENKDRKTESTALALQMTGLQRQIDVARTPSREEFDILEGLVRRIELTLARIEAKLDTPGSTNVHIAGRRPRGEQRE